MMVSWRLKTKEETAGEDGCRRGQSHESEQRRESSEVLAERLVREELKKTGWREADLAKYRKGAAAKASIAQRFKKETTMTLKWIAQRLKMGSASMVTHCFKGSKRRIVNYWD
jgi:methylphosphotriester-DNA--protein-cysteine methyltransferase